ncbi:hypothetical protein BGZ76_001113 [Entomortierella beljakovae]|nr:hypothetical protein BGZ76_001113 [Entomortierella beljakovae]
MTDLAVSLPDHLINGSHHYDSCSIDYSMYYQENTLCDDSFELSGTWGPSNESDTFQFGTLERSDSFDSFIIHENEFDTMSQSYTNLWEIQLELGEIPDMISNNLLEPCPLLDDTRDSSYPSGLYERIEISYQNHEVNDEVEEELEESEERESDEEEEDDDDEGESDIVWTSELSIKSEPPVQNEHPLPSKSIFDFRASQSTGAYLEQEYGDRVEKELFEDDADEDEERGGKWDQVVNHPVYGMLSSSLELQGGEFRHDRKDSGIFLQLDRDENEYTVQRSDPLSDDTKALPSVHLYERRNSSHERHGSAAYQSLQRIASSFVSL